MNDGDMNVALVTSKASFIGIAGIAAGAIILMTGLSGEIQVKYLHGILGLFAIIAGIIIASTKKETSIASIGNKLMWGGWMMLPINAAGFLLAMSSYYTAGLGGLVWILLLGHLAAALLGLYTIFYSHKETGTPLAP